ncbi:MULTISPECIES: hypothetical protein [Vibrio]|uniref:hypothetical protein n=1 Tax=Vibrio TaxID=662 RepID=UPI0018665309|nr:hypothetical protein [Vibrio litoralis]
MLLAINFNDIHRARNQYKDLPKQLKKLDRIAQLLFADNPEILALIHQQTKPFKFHDISQNKLDNNLVYIVLTKNGYTKYKIGSEHYWWKKNLTTKQIKELLK